MRRAARIALVAVVVSLLLAGGAGMLLGGGVLHPAVRPLTPQLIAEADRMLERVGATREEFDVRAPDGILLRGWKVRPAPRHAPAPSRQIPPPGEDGTLPNGDWVLLFHGVSDNRAGMLGHAELLLRAGYGVVMMDARAHGASEGPMATYGWKEREDTRAITDALYAAEKPHCLFALGESMGAAIALQSAAVEPRIAGVVAESSFSDLREASYDYAGLHISSWLGKTLFRPGAVLVISAGQKEAGFKAEDVSPVKAVAARAFPILLICGTRDHTLPPRHSKRILQAARGPKQLWLVAGAGHAAALGTAPAEFERRVLAFYRAAHAAK
jgi:alpha-beta hydrolase superfamily lysophospholipase